MKTQTQSILHWFFTLLIIEWLLALYSFYSNLTNFANLEDLSISRLIINLGLLGITALLVGIVMGFWLRRPWTQRLNSTVTTYLANQKVYWIIVFLSGVGVILNLYIVLAYQSLARARVENLFIAPYLEFTQPFAWYMLLAAIQVTVAARILRFGVGLSVYQPYRHAFRTVLKSLLIFSLLVVFTGLTGLGLRTDVVGWGTPGVPIIGIQVLLALAVLSAIWGLKELLLSKFNQTNGRITWGIPDWSADLVICILLWGVAVWLWGGQPLKPTYFSPAPLPPNFEYYPNSDAVHYDLDAIKLLNGVGYDPDAIRPLYVLFLALSHAVNGLDYQSVVPWQVMLYAMIPVLIFLLGKSLHHRFTGALAGSLLVLREYNAIALSGEINTCTRQADHGRSAPDLARDRLRFDHHPLAARSGFKESAPGAGGWGFGIGNPDPAAGSGNSADYTAHHPGIFLAQAIHVVKKWVPAWSEQLDCAITLDTAHMAGQRDAGLIGDG